MGNSTSDNKQNGNPKDNPNGNQAQPNIVDISVK